MESQDLFNMAAGFLGAIGGWLLNTMWQAVRSLETKVAAIDVLVAGQYMRKEEATRMFDALFTKLDKIQDAIEKKADKP
jgi:hypothetical protein